MSRFKSKYDELDPFEILLQDPSSIDFDKENFTKKQLELITDTFLKEDSKREICRTCFNKDETIDYGIETGKVESAPQYNEEGDPIEDEEGKQLYLSFPEYKCSLNHRWFKGEGKARSIGIKNNILFEEHLKARQSREIFNSVGVPDPSIVAGLYNRTHPSGRKVNDAATRKKSGASFYK